MNEQKIRVKSIKSLIFVLAILIIGGVVAEFIEPQTVNVSAMKTFEKPIYRVETQEKIMAISFDAAWGADYTPIIMDILDERKIKTTFFLVGIWVNKYPDMVKEISARGHEIGNHSDTHQHMSQLNEQEVIEEIKECEKLIDRYAKDSRANVFRPPFGEYNQQLLNVCNQLDYQCIQWTIDSLDWKATSSQAIIQKVVPKFEPGAIILFHNNGEYTTEALPYILDEAIKQGYKIVPISQITYNDNYKIDQFGIQRYEDIATPEVKKQE